MSDMPSLYRAALFLNASEDRTYRDGTRAAAIRVVESIIARHAEAGEPEDVVRRIVARLAAIQKRHRQ